MPFRNLLAVIFTFSFLFWGAARGYYAIQFKRQCSGFLKQAGDSNTIELAKSRLQKAIDYIESNSLTKGYTSIVYTTPNEDVGFWYTNLRQAFDDINSVDDSATQLERSNVLMKLRETLLDDTSSGVKVTVPRGISVFPNNVLFALWGSISVIVGFIFSSSATKKLLLN